MQTGRARDPSLGLSLPSTVSGLNQKLDLGALPLICLAGLSPHGELEGARSFLASARQGCWGWGVFLGWMHLTKGLRVAWDARE